MAVSKTKPTEAVVAALAAGQFVFGENRVQEAAEKFPTLRAAHPGLRLHLIGGLQTNKARDAVRLADVIETLDRPRLADALEAAIDKEARRPDEPIPTRPSFAALIPAGLAPAEPPPAGLTLIGLTRTGPTPTGPTPTEATPAGPAPAGLASTGLALTDPSPSLLIEVNTGAEPQKSGIPRAEADRFIADCQARFGQRLRGLMCVPPMGEDPRPHFIWLAECARRHGLPVLSMGMSADFELAIACGATSVRVGSAIFGIRR
ncbi:MAG: YggS family pyridoxal phosphate enzyme [Acetobacteraceae bacterium]